MRAVLVLIIVAVGLVASLRSRVAALCLYLWFSLFYPQEWAWGALYPYRLSLVIGMVLFLSSAFTGVFLNLTHPLSIASVLIVTVALVAQLQAFSPDATWQWFIQLSTVVAVSLLMVSIVRDRRAYLIVLGVIAGSLGLHAAHYGAVFLLSGGARFNQGIGGTFSDNNDFGLALARVLPLLVATALCVKSRWLRLSLFGSAFLGIFAIVGTYSRGAFLAIGAGTLAYILSQERKVLALAIFAGVVGTGFYFVPLPEDYIGRVETIQTFRQKDEQSALGRLYFWQVALRIAEDHPMGVGLRNFERAFDSYDTTGGAYGTERSVHSSHFQILAETGYAGFAVWCALLVYSLWLSLRIRGLAKTGRFGPDASRFYLAVANGLIASQIAFIVGGSFLAQALNDLNWLTFGLVAALHRISSAEVQGAAAATGVVSR